MAKLLNKTWGNKHQWNISLVLAVIIGIAGLGILLSGLSGQKSPPRPRISTTAAVPAPADYESHTSRPYFSADRSEPVRLEIPAIDVDTDMAQIAKNADGTIEVPSGTNYDKAAWYKYSVTPGESGSSVILGHVDSEKNGPSVFFNLGALKPGDKILVKRADNTSAVFSVYAVNEYPKDKFPTAEVYKSTSSSTLKLITCSGEFDKPTGEYTSNIVVSAVLSDLNT